MSGLYLKVNIGASLLMMLVLIVISGIYQAAELVLASINEEKVEGLREADNNKKELLNAYMSDKSSYLQNLKLGKIFNDVLITGIAIITFLPRLNNFLYGYVPRISFPLSILLITMIMAFVIIVFTELLPKRIALKDTGDSTYKYIKISNFFSKVLKPFAKFVSFFTVIVLKATNNYTDDMEEKISEEELRSMIRVGEEQGVINSEGKDMIINIFEFDDSSAYEIMTPRTEIYMVNEEDFGVNTITDEILKSGYSRIPVYRDSPDDIIGIVYLKDLFVEFSKNNYQSIDLKKVMKKPYFVPESKKLDLLLKELQASKNYVALLIDEYGGLSGMVTVEDIVEEIVGEIEDEYDISEAEIRKINEEQYLIEGNTELKTINSKLDLDLDSENHETLGGFIVEHLGFFPEDVKDGPFIVNAQGVSLKVLEIEDNRIKKALLSILDE